MFSVLFENIFGPIICSYQSPWGQKDLENFIFCVRMNSLATKATERGTKLKIEKTSSCERRAFFSKRSPYLKTQNIKFLMGFSNTPKRLIIECTSIIDDISWLFISMETCFNSRSKAKFSIIER